MAETGVRWQRVSYLERGSCSRKNNYHLGLYAPFFRNAADPDCLYRPCAPSPHLLAFSSLIGLLIWIKLLRFLCVLLWVCVQLGAEIVIHERGRIWRLIHIWPLFLSHFLVFCLLFKLLPIHSTDSFKEIFPTFRFKVLCLSFKVICHALKGKKCRMVNCFAGESNLHVAKWLLIYCVICCGVTQRKPISFEVQPKTWLLSWVVNIFVEILL
jgi:hypothetical protein